MATQYLDLTGLTYYDNKIKSDTATKLTTALGAYYDKEAVDKIVSDMKTASYQVVSNRPTTGEEGIIYLVGTEAPYDMYIYEPSLSTTDKWIFLGDTGIDISNYVPTTRKVAGVDLADDITVSELSSALSLSTYAKSSALSSYVTIGTAQTITGAKTFDNDITLGSGYYLYATQSGYGAQYSATAIKVINGSNSYEQKFQYKAGTIALTSDIPSLTNYVTLSTDQTISGTKTFTKGVVSNVSFTASADTSTSLTEYSDGHITRLIDESLETIQLPDEAGTLALVSYVDTAIAGVTMDTISTDDIDALFK